MPEIEWSHEGKPEEPGWYAALWCWEANEGSWIGAKYFTGTKWDDRPNQESRRGLKGYPVTSYAGPFETEEEADAWAWEHDISW